VNPAVNDLAFNGIRPFIQKTVRSDFVPSVARQPDSHSKESGGDENGFELLKIHGRSFIQYRLIFKSNQTTAVGGFFSQ
jgi:hypothetical protein